MGCVIRQAPRSSYDPSILSAHSTTHAGLQISGPSIRLPTLHSSICASSGGHDTVSNPQDCHELPFHEDDPSLITSYFLCYRLGCHNHTILSSIPEFTGPTSHERSAKRASTIS
ncbi:hypothetical protein M8818_005277 [Zalaria obscura]|uniref:Uncharacterized protein n=1 Tax=Zalaria obscura TaxID=2024903 RepID=A0ACC3S9C8_9PEZI